MLNGTAPILIFTFTPNFLAGIQQGFAGIPVIGSLSSLIGIPIPIYLDEKTTGLYIDNQTKAIDIDTVPLPRYDGKPPAVDQRGLNNLVTVNMFARKDSIMMTVLLALIELIFGQVVAKTYSVTYLNGTTTVFGGLLHGFSTQEGSDDDLIRITIQLSKANQNAPTPPSVPTVLPKITGATPVQAVAP